MTSLCASEAFYKQLKDLFINDFPCGLGSWRPKLSSNELNPRFDCGSAECDSINDLLELEASAPYSIDCTWSKEAKSLRKIAVESPEFLNDPNFILKHFTTLRIVNKNVYNIDESILKFVNLKELFLGGNFIEDVDGRNLPTGLEVLELSANKIKSLNGLKGDNLCSLLHLGLAHNEVSSISSRAVTPSKWPSLLSLDLSYNNLDDLQETIEKLKGLPVLRNLLLIGNPLYLSKCYRGYVIDSIPGLSFLDETEVTADDRHHFKSFSRLKDINTNTCQITVEIIGLNGVKKPAELEDIDSAPDYPKIEFKYHVEFTFLHDVTGKEPMDETSEVKKENISPMNVVVGDQVDPHLIVTETLPWSDTLEFNFNKILNSSELANLCSFLQTGVTFTVVGVKHSYVVEDPQVAENANRGESQRGSVSEKPTNKSASKSSKDAKEKAKSASKKPDKGAKDKGRKDKRATAELFELPQERKIVGSYNMKLGSLLEGEETFTVCSPCKEEGVETVENNGQTIETSGKQQSAKKKNKDGDKPTKAAQSKPKSKEVIKSAAPGTKGIKGGKAKEKLDEVQDEAEDEAQAPLPPLSINFKIKLNRWKTTKDVLQKMKS